MHDPQAMTVGHRRRHAAQECHTLPHRQSVRPSETVYGKRMLHQFHHKERDRHAAMATGAERVDLRDVGMPQPRQQVRFLLEAFHDPAAGKAVAQDLHRDRPCGGYLTPLVDAAHAPLSQHADDRDPPQIAAGRQVDDLLPLKTERISLAGELAGEVVQHDFRRGRAWYRMRAGRAFHRPAVIRSG